MNDRDRYLNEFEEKGEEWVRERVTRGLFSDFKANLARHWLDQRKRKSGLRDRFSTHTAAWIGAVAAVVAAIASLAGLFQGK